jgi:hypothetical protein
MSNESEQVAQRYAFSHYGNLILVDDPVFDEESGLYCSNLRSDYPLLIRDAEQPERPILHTLRIDSLGAIVVNKENRVMKDRTTSREACIETLKLFLKLWKKRSEEIIVSASANNLVRISRFRHFFDPIDSILISLWDYRKVYDLEIEHARFVDRRKKMRLYLQLLEGLEIVRRGNECYTPGNTFASVRAKEPNEEKFRDAILSHIIRERYPTLRDVFKLTILEPTIHIDSCIYLPELELEKSIHRTTDSIIMDYAKYYQRRINELDLRLILKRLENAEAIDRKGKHYFGNEQLLSKMVKIKKELPPVSMELLTKA